MNTELNDRAVTMTTGFLSAYSKRIGKITNDFVHKLFDPLKQRVAELEAQHLVDTARSAKQDEDIAVLRSEVVNLMASRDATRKHLASIETKIGKIARGQG